MLVFLHGAGERGIDNARQLTWLPMPLSEPPLAEALPWIVLAVQCPPDLRWSEVAWDAVESSPLPASPSPALAAVRLAMEEVRSRYPVDPNRLHLTGLSMGGYGALDLAMREPELFAGVVAVCGGGSDSEAPRLRSLPLWLWHGAEDRVVPPIRSRRLFEILHDLNAPVRYTELPGVAHDSWRQAYTPTSGALEWLFLCHR
jgi:predicted peptidase